MIRVIGRPLRRKLVQDGLAYLVRGCGLIRGGEVYFPPPAPPFLVSSANLDV